MAVYFVTGKLGSGKTLASVGKIRDVLIEGRPVATNLELRLNKLIGPNAKKTVVYRLPDKPALNDMVGIGSGNLSYDEEKNGLIVLDECGTWFNARSWQDKDRPALIEWLLHARKLGWDIIFIIQDISMIDKQARKSVGEFVVYCRRLDRLKYPLVDTIAKLITNKHISKPKIHMGIVKYGDLPNSLKVDTWWYRGVDLYPAFDTKQMFSDNYPHGMYQVLPPHYTHGRYACKKTWRFFMRLTKIYLKRFSKVAALIGGLLAGVALASVMQPEPEVLQAPVPNALSEDVSDSSGITPPGVFSDELDKPLTLSEKFAGFVISGIAQDETGKVIFAEIASKEERYNVENLRAAGHIVRFVDRCEILIMNEDRSDTVRLHTSYCGPDKPLVTSDLELPRMSPQERYQLRLEQVRATERLQNNY
ncbi:zonular occludens toxin domain-containing protein [Marinobacter gelidimuriae]|uniref:zonular occludens toxin domain-containing protein n=1 Tax=Marinobacter gelidimuriae TaxID=2739064 RepID=UPI0003622DCF|nr:zonular occludens toxin domain-containing protein [Marinobacter gelidimuriae]